MIFKRCLILLMLFLIVSMCDSFTFIPRNLRCSQSSPTKVIQATKAEDTTVFSQASLIAGTTIGGGFMALPAVTAPVGGASSALGLGLTWGYLLWAALSLNSVIFRLRDSSDEPLSIMSVVEKSMGPVVASSAAISFQVLILATMVAQLSKIGVMFDFPWSRGVSTIMFSLIIFLVSLLGTDRGIERLNDTLTIAMVSSFAAIVGLAVQPGSGFQASRLVRSNFKALLPTSNGGPWVISVFVQLLLYAEVIPKVAERLKDERKVQKAVVFGSLVPMGMCLVWTFVALGLVPFEEAAVIGKAVASKGAGVATMYDPLTTLTAIVARAGAGAGARAGATSLKLLLVSIKCLTFSAITTTMIGSVLASSQLLETTTWGSGWRQQSFDVSCEDTFPSDVDCVMTNNNTDSALVDGVASVTTTVSASPPIISFRKWNWKWTRRAISRLLSIAPAAMVATLGSQRLYYSATAFAGAYPCIYLYGLLPALANLRLEIATSNRPKVIFGSTSLALTSLSFLAANIL